MGEEEAGRGAGGDDDKEKEDDGNVDGEDGEDEDIVDSSNTLPVDPIVREEERAAGETAGRT